MSVKHSLLALLADQPRYGYELRAAFESSTGDAWPLNVGQVYTTLSRLERDGLVEQQGSDGDGHVYYRLTERGRREVNDWWNTPVGREAPARDELAIKIALAILLPEVDVTDVLQRQRTATLRALQAHTRRRNALARSPDPRDTASSLVLDALVFATEAEIRWLDHCEARLARLNQSRNGRS